MSILNFCFRFFFLLQISLLEMLIAVRNEHLKILFQNIGLPFLFFDPHPSAPSSHPPSEEEDLIRHLRAGTDSVHLLTPRMPDIVPIVRRPVKKLNSPPIFDKRAETETNNSNSVSGLGRKFSLPTDKSSKVKRICEGNLPVKSKVLPKREEELPVAVSFPKYDASDFVSAKQKRNVLPELRVAEAAQRVAKTTVSLFIFLPLSCSSACLGAFNALLFFS